MVFSVFCCAKNFFKKSLTGSKYRMIAYYLYQGRRYGTDLEMGTLKRLSSTSSRRLKTTILTSAIRKTVIIRQPALNLKRRIR